MYFVQRIRKCHPQEVLVKQNEEKEIASNHVYNDGKEKAFECFRRENRMGMNKGLDDGERSSHFRGRMVLYVWSTEVHGGRGHMHSFVMVHSVLLFMLMMPISNGQL